ncbi:Hint domain-containing protein [Albibacillus kandeliae]|uniref:Hint domain-containing protein n=1 Tax=Albibacillus kandeliae TaxID=2174228 RepID=UPI000D68C0CF|nr:Hint domain-containing protein [Albibacillus kandeliae]
MKTGFRGTFVISWSQTDIDGLEAAPLDALQVGAAWSWRGEAVQVDGPNDVLRLEGAEEVANLRRHAARKVRRLVGAAMSDDPATDADDDDAPLRDCSFVVTNGAQSFTVTLIETGPGRVPLLMFLDSLPPRNAELWVVRHTLDAVSERRDPDAPGVICFTPGTRIAVPGGTRPVDDLREGDLVLTRDNGPQEICWTGQRRLSGARLHVMPWLRPIRFGPGALGIERPDAALLVSPEHRMLVKGRAARALFNTDEVLVSASALVNDRTIRVDTRLREVTYIHLLLPSHQIIWANGVETESFHPAHADLDELGEGDRRRLLETKPGLDRDPYLYGAFARRNLTRSEAAILAHEAA